MKEIKVKENEEEIREVTKEVRNTQVKKNYTYILRCSDGTYYTGWTTDIKKRLATHNAGKGAKYTRCRLPVELVYFEEFSTKEEAMSREIYIKRMKRAEKQILVDNFDFKHCNL